MNIANYFGQIAKIRPATLVAHEVDDEIDFHIESRVQDLIRQGLGEVEARAQTNAQFGDRRQIGRQCREIQAAPARRLAWVSGILSAIALGIIGWLGWSLVSLKLEHANLLNRLNASAIVPSLATSPGANALPASQDQAQTLSGKVLDSDGKPITNAKVLLIHKSWRGSYSQADHSTETDSDGKWKFEELYHTDIQNAFLVTVVADGFEMKSDYSTHEAKKSPGDINFRLKPATKKVVTFQDADGNALVEADVVVLSRKSGTKEHMVYEQNALVAKKVTNDDGQAEFSCLLKGDTATLGILVFGEFQKVELKIEDEDAYVVKLEKKTP